MPLCVVEFYFKEGEREKRRISMSMRLTGCTLSACGRQEGSRNLPSLLLCELSARHYNNGASERIKGELASGRHWSN